MQQIKESNQKIISQLSGFIEQFSNDEYALKIDLISDSSIGMHVRHILEFYSCFLDNISNNEICYDSRKRQLVFEVDVNSTLEKFKDISNQIDTISENTVMCIASNTSSNERDSVIIKTNIAIEINTSATSKGVF